MISVIATLVYQKYNTVINGKIKFAFPAESLEDAILGSVYRIIDLLPAMIEIMDISVDLYTKTPEGNVLFQSLKISQ